MRDAFWLFRLHGVVDRLSYVIAGLVLLGCKWNLDRLLAGLYGHRRWLPVDYFDYQYFLDAVRNGPGGPRQFVALLCLTSLPFAWMGAALTLRRLRHAGLPTWLTVLFFLPMLNWALFLLACVAGPRCADGPTAADSPAANGELGWLRFVPESRSGATLTGVLAGVVHALASVAIGVGLMSQYGVAVFVFLPFSMGFVGALVFALRHPGETGGAVRAGMMSLPLAGAALFVFAMEGAVCLLMAAPMAGLMGLMGAFFGAAIGASMAPKPGRLLCVGGSWPFLALFAECLMPGTPPLHETQSAIDIAAPPAVVWREVVAFRELGPPKEWVFRAGVAYPLRASIKGRGVGAVRHCEFSTGPFVEPITVWDEPRRLAFDVASCPPPLQEWSIYAHVDPPHLHGYMESERGEFRLEPLPGGGTRLIGTTWYRNRMWPAAYWRLATDYLIGTIHARVLAGIKASSEALPPTTR